MDNCICRSRLTMVCDLIQSIHKCALAVRFREWPFKLYDLINLNLNRVGLQTFNTNYVPLLKTNGFEVLACLTPVKFSFPSKALNTGVLGTEAAWFKTVKGSLLKPIDLMG